MIDIVTAMERSEVSCHWCIGGKIGSSCRDDLLLLPEILPDLFRARLDLNLLPLVHVISLILS